MLLALGNVTAQALLDSMKVIAADRGEKHEFHQRYPHGTFVHYDGWGACWYSLNKWEHHHSVRPISLDPSTQNFFPTNPSLLLLHVRRKSIGDRTHHNCHPFSVIVRGIKYIFTHNGHIPKSISYDHSFTPQGKTDSEKLFYAILSSPDFQENPIAAVAKTLSLYQNAKGNNVILSCATWSIVAIAPTRYSQYFTMKLARTQDQTVISSQVVPSSIFNHTSWENLLPGNTYYLDHQTRALKTIPLPLMKKTVTS